MSQNVLEVTVFLASLSNKRRPQRLESPRTFQPLPKTSKNFLDSLGGQQQEDLGS